MIQDLDDTLKALLVREARLEPGEVDIKFDMPSPDWSGRLSRPTVNLYLYDVRENLELRSNDLYLTRNEERTAGTQRRAPTRVDLSYMISVWAEFISDEHRLLGQILTALLSHPLLPDDVLMGAMRNQPFPVRAWIAQPERIPNAWDFWGHVEHRMKSGLSYVVTASFEPFEAEEVRLVTERQVNLKQGAVRPPRPANPEPADLSQSASFSKSV